MGSIMTSQGPQMRVFCEADHDRTECSFDPIQRYHNCTLCLLQVTEEYAFQSIPKHWRDVLTNPVASVIAILADIYAIDVIFKDKINAYYETRRQKDLA